MQLCATIHAPAAVLAEGLRGGTINSALARHILLMGTIHQPVGFPIPERIISYGLCDEYSEGSEAVRAAKLTLSFATRKSKLRMNRC